MQMCEERAKKDKMQDTGPQNSVLCELGYMVVHEACSQGARF